MADEPKIPWHPGRRKGAINRKTKSFRETLEAHGYDVAEALLSIYKHGLDVFHNGHPDDKVQGLKIAGDMAKEIAGYVMPKLKAIEHTTSNPLSGMSPKERLEAMKQAVLMLEKEVKPEVIEIGATNMENTKAKEAEQQDG